MCVVQYEMHMQLVYCAFCLQAAETARMIKKKIITQQESLRFGKSLEMASKALKPQGAAPSSSYTGGTTSSGCHQVPLSHVMMSSPSSATHDTSSVISFAMPMSTSTPKSASQPPTSSKQESSATSPSMTYPVMSLIRHVDPKSEHSVGHHGHKDEHHARVHDPKGQGQRHEMSGHAYGEPAVLPVTSSETSSGHRKSDRKLGKEAEKPKSVDLNSQKSAARAAFFSSLTSPSTPTTTSSPISTGTTLLIESPTEGSAKISPAAGTSPLRGIPTLVRSLAVTMPCSSMSTAVTQPMIQSTSSISSSLVSKPSSLPVSGSSVVSSQKFSPASPANSATSASSRPRTTFTAIPKPYSPTKSTPSPLTPESPKYRIPPSQQTSVIPASMHVSDSSRRVIGPGSQAAGKDSVVRPKKVPPPPPPRKSSKLPGQAVLAVNSATVNGQLPKPTGKFSESHISKPSVTFDTKPKGPTDIIKPPKQFANIELETKVERKSSIGSLKQFTTPLLESKRDKKDQKDSGQPETVGKKVSSSNLDLSDKKTKPEEKDIDVSKGEQTEIEQLETPRKIIDGKVTNVSDSQEGKHERTDSVDSTSSSSSFDSQKDIWFKRKDEVSEACPSDTITQPTEDSSDVSGVSKTTEILSASSSSVKSTSEDAGSGGGRKKPKPPPPERRSSLSSKSKTDEAAEIAEQQERTGKTTTGSIDRLV